METFQLNIEILFTKCLEEDSIKLSFYHVLVMKPLIFRMLMLLFNLLLIEDLVNKYFKGLAVL
jgi:hypothetical protein